MKQDKLFYFTLLLLCFKGFFLQFVRFDDILNFGVDVLALLLALKTPKHTYAFFKGNVGIWTLYSATVFFTIGIFADILNLMPPMTVAWGIKGFLRYFLLLYAILGRRDKLSAEDFRKFWYHLFVLNVAACVIEFFAGIRGDMMGGTFSGNGELSVVMTISAILFSCDYFKKRTSSIKLAALIVAAFVIAMWAEIKFLYFVIPLCVYASYVMVRKFSVVQVVVLCVAFFCIVPVLKYTLSFYYDADYVESVFDEEDIDKYTTHSAYNLSAQGISFNRGTCVEMAEDLFLQDPVHYYIGYGLGSGSNSNTFGSWIAQAFRDTAYFYFTASYVLVEAGWAGFVFFVSVYVFILLRFLLIYWKNKDKIIRYWASVGTLMAAITFLFMWYNSTPYVNYYLPFTLWGFCFLGIYDRKKTLVCNEVQKNNQE